jgi:hypothetical protein
MRTTGLASTASATGPALATGTTGLASTAGSAGLACATMTAWTTGLARAAGATGLALATRTAGLAWFMLRGLLAALAVGLLCWILRADRGRSRRERRHGEAACEECRRNDGEVLAVHVD